jgi:hypothetical protein
MSEHEEGREWPTPVTDALVSNRPVFDAIAGALARAWDNRDPMREMLPPSDRERALREEVAAGAVLLGAVLLDFLAAPQKKGAGGDPGSA